MRRRPRMDSQRLRITHIGQVRDQLEVIHDLATRLAAALDAEREHASEALLEVLLRRLVAGVAFQTRIRHPGDVRVALEPARQLESVIRVPLCAERQRLDAEEELLRSEGVQRCAVVAQDLDAGTDDEGDWAKSVVELEAVVSLAGIVHLREALRVLAPVELSAVDNDAADGGAVTAYPFRGRVHDDVGAVLDGAYEVAACAEGVVYDDGDAGCVGDFGDLLKVWDVVFGVADGFDVDCFGVVVDGGLEVFGLVTVDELCFDTETWEGYFELVVCAAVSWMVSVYREMGCYGRLTGWRWR